MNINLWLQRHRPIMVSSDYLAGLRFRAMWHCPSCTETKVSEHTTEETVRQHDRNKYGRKP